MFQALPPDATSVFCSKPCPDAAGVFVLSLTAGVFVFSLVPDTADPCGATSLALGFSMPIAQSKRGDLGIIDC